jgi:hypothetical protein
MTQERKAAQKAASRKHYLANRASIIERSAVLRQEKRELMLAHLMKHPCVDCGETDPVVLDFDHVEPAKKLFSISNGVSAKRTTAALLTEIEKCEVRCANCHRRRTAQQFNWWKYRETN